MNVTITGENGYISNEIATWLRFTDKQMNLQLISVRGKIKIPINTDVLIHTAAIVHKKENHYQESDYFKINTDLTIELAKKAKDQGVKHFVFFSTMAVYGVEQGEINQSSLLQPKTFYGKSKLAAEQALQSIEDESFTISIVRPPMIYGPNCPGNYKLLRKLAIKTPIFPYVQNQRSMLYIDNLCEFIYQLIINKDAGVFHPQDHTYINTAKMVLEISKQHKRHIILSKISGLVIIKFFSDFTLVNKVFGNLTYAKNISKYRDNSYQRSDFKESIQKTEVIGR
ncbi:NAD-dependent epimerase/dehydratase family protein [Lysinibacillus sphaericus]|uniref:NAD-dependent epimerase/dehydratase family protein n=1 Tax=Lysinibacillus sphaericus TaxID=1421 RepID=UPI003D02C23C